MNDGIAVPFFGQDAMTAPAMAQFALKFKCPLVPMRIERLKGARFRLTFYPPIDIQDTGLDNVYFARHYHQGCSPPDFVGWFAEKYDLIPINSCWVSGLLK